MLNKIRCMLFGHKRRTKGCMRAKFTLSGIRYIIQWECERCGKILDEWA
jgi:hypothetical protein